MFCVSVTLQIDRARMAEFLPLMTANAHASVTGEPGCQRFDVWSEGATVYLYEVYDDRAAFDAHLATAHFKAFDAAVQGMVTSKQILTLGTRHA